MSKVQEYRERFSHPRRPFGPPFTCPWANEGCPKISQSVKEHTQHIASVHEGMKVCRCGHLIARAGEELCYKCRIKESRSNVARSQ